MRTLQARWFALLDSLRKLGISFCCLQETGVGYDKHDVQQARIHVQAWSRQRNSPDAAAKIWCAARPTAAKTGGLGAGIAVLALGAWAARGQPERSWADGSTLSVQFALAGKASVTVTCQYAPTGGGDTTQHEAFRCNTDMTKDELDL